MDSLWLKIRLLPNSELGHKLSIVQPYRVSPSSSIVKIHIFIAVAIHEILEIFLRN